MANRTCPNSKKPQKDEKEEEAASATPSPPHGLTASAASARAYRLPRKLSHASRMEFQIAAMARKNQPNQGAMKRNTTL